MTNIKKENKVKHLIGSLVNEPQKNHKLDREILAILCDNYFKYKVFIEKTTKDITKELLEFHEKEYLGFKELLQNTEQSDNLFVRTELYRLQRLGMVKFIHQSCTRYTIKATEKGLQYLITLTYSEMLQEGAKNISHFVDENGEMWFGGEYGG